MHARAAKSSVAWATTVDIGGRSRRTGERHWEIEQGWKELVRPLDYRRAPRLLSSVTSLFAAAVSASLGLVERAEDFRKSVGHANRGGSGVCKAGRGPDTFWLKMCRRVIWLLPIQRRSKIIWRFAGGNVRWQHSAGYPALHKTHLVDMCGGRMACINHIPHL